MMDFNQLCSCLKQYSASGFIFKELSENDNSKNQVYLGGSYEVLQEIPHGAIVTYSDCKRPNMKAKLDFWWIDDKGSVSNAPGAQLILYPKYPEVRLSGFLQGCRNAPSNHFKVIKREERTGDKDGRVLVMAPVGERIYAYLAPRGSSIAAHLIGLPHDGLFGHVEFGYEDSKTELIRHLRIQYATNPHELVKMFPDGEIRPYKARNAAGYTLEASFGIIPNGTPEPDFKGWELKCYGSSSVTLMTPEPDGGLYEKLGTRDFVEQYGHVAEDGGMYFTGPYRATENTKFGSPRKLVVEGFNMEEGKIEDVDGAIVLLQDEDTELATWSFSHLLGHWGRKHNKACYVRYEKESDTQINYLPKVFLGEGTSPIFLLRAILANVVIYDPGSRVKLDGSMKARSQFRINHKDLCLLYSKYEHVDISK